MCCQMMAIDGTFLESDGHQLCSHRSIQIGEKMSQVFGGNFDCNQKLASSLKRSIQYGR